MVINKPMIVVAAVVVAAASGLAYYLHSRSKQPAHVPVAAQPAAPAEEPAIEHPVPAATGESAAKGPLPALADSDPAMRDALGEVAGTGAVTQYLVPDNIIRHIVVTIDNLPRQKVPVEKRPTVAVPGTFLADGDELHATLDPKNFARYEPMVAVVRKIDMQRLARCTCASIPCFNTSIRISDIQTATSTIDWSR